MYHFSFTAHLIGGNGLKVLGGAVSAHSLHAYVDSEVKCNFDIKKTN